MNLSTLSSEVRETQRIWTRTASVKREWRRDSGADRIRGPGTAALAGIRWTFLLATAAGPALLPLFAWREAADGKGRTEVLLVGLLLILSCVRAFTSMEGDPLRPFVALRMPSRRAFLLAGWWRRAPWVLATSFSWAATIALALPRPWTASHALLPVTAMLAPPLLVALWTWSENPGRKTRDFQRGASVFPVLLGAGLCAAVPVLHPWIPGFAGAKALAVVVGLVMICGHGWDIVRDRALGPIVAFRRSRFAAGLLETPVRFVLGLLPILIVGVSATNLLGAGLSKTLAIVTWPAVAAFVACQAAAALVAAWMVVADFEAQDCTWTRSRDGDEPRTESGPGFRPRPALLAEPAPRGLAAALRFRAKAEGRSTHWTSLTIGLLILGVGFASPENGWSALLGVLFIWRTATVDPSPRLHLLGVPYVEQHLHNLRRTAVDVGLPVALAALFWGTLFGWGRPGAFVPVAVAGGALLFRSGLTGAWRLLDRPKWKAPIGVTLLALLVVTVFAKGVFGPDPVRTHLLLAAIYGGLGLAGLAWHLATLDEGRLREENRGEVP